jgi:hypothetical protein
VRNVKREIIDMATIEMSSFEIGIVEIGIARQLGKR